MQPTTRFEKFYRKLPLITGLVFAIFWGAIFFFFAKLHGMPAMFDQQFPFFVARILNVHNETMSSASGALFAMLDAGIAGAALGWLFRGIFAGR